MTPIRVLYFISVITALILLISLICEFSYQRSIFGSYKIISILDKVFITSALISYIMSYYASSKA